jgi:hypothetical protein
VPFFIAGRAGVAFRAVLHLKAPNATPLANVMLTCCTRGFGRPGKNSATANGVFDVNADNNDRQLEARIKLPDPHPEHSRMSNPRRDSYIIVPELVVERHCASPKPALALS